MTDTVDTPQPDTRSTRHIDEYERIADILSQFEVGMLTTVDQSGELTARPMARQRTPFEDGTLWFLTERGSRKVRQLDADPRASITFSSHGTWLTISGHAELLDDRSVVHDLWDAGAEAFLPQGPDDPSVVALRLVGEHAEYIDNPLGRIATAISFVKAKMTGEPFEAADTGSVDL